MQDAVKRFGIKLPDPKTVVCKNPAPMQASDFFLDKQQMCELQEVERWCNWTPDSATVSYLRSYSRSTLLAAAGWSTSGERMFFSERFHIEVIFLQ
jgi:hypothetical protein